MNSDQEEREAQAAKERHDKLRADVVDGKFKSFLGDGLYVDWDGFHIRLSAERDGLTHWVGLEPEVLERFERYVVLIRAAIKECHDGR